MPTITQRVVRNARKRGVKVVDRIQWGNTSTIYQKRRRTRPHKSMPSDTLWQHITVTKRKGIRYDMRTLHKIGMERFGSGVSYNFGIDMVTGEIGVGQALDAKGTHTVNNKGIPNYSYDQNFVSHAFAFIGMPGDLISNKAIDAAAKLFAAMIDEGALTKDPDYNPHSMVAYKDCPTDAAREVMPLIKKKAKEYAKKSFKA